MFMKEYHERVFKDMLTKVPVFFLRYEDLVLDPMGTLSKLFCFILNKESIAGLNIEHRIQEVIKIGHSATLAYEQK